ncbi:BatA domain-containing protein [Thalassotalea piscium]
MMSSLFPFSTIQPWAWYGLVALAIPLIIHLLSKSKGRLVQWGTTRFLPQATPIKMTQVKLVERLLLLIRCLIILFSLAILAQLFLTSRSQNAETIILVSKHWFEQSDQQTKSSLEQYKESAKYQLIWLDTLESLVVDDKVTPLSLDEQSKSIINKTSVSSIDMWQALSFASKKFAQAQQFIVYCDASTQQFVGEKPLIKQTIEWHMSFENQQVNLNDVIEKPFNVVVYADDGHQDALDYLLPALTVIQQLSVEKLSVHVVNDAKTFALMARPDWVFYLTNKPITTSLEQWVSQGTNVFIDGNNSPSLIQDQRREVINGYGLLNKIIIYQTTKQVNKLNVENKEHPIWVSEDNYPLLSVINKNTSLGKIYRFSSVFLPSWTNIVTQPQFPLVLQSLLFGDVIAIVQAEKNQVSVNNIDGITRRVNKPFSINYKSNPQISVAENDLSEDSHHQSLLIWLGLLLIVLFLLERIISELSIRDSVAVNHDD